MVFARGADDVGWHEARQPHTESGGRGCFWWTSVGNGGAERGQHLRRELDLPENGHHDHGGDNAPDEEHDGECHERQRADATDGGRASRTRQRVDELRDDQRHHHQSQGIAPGRADGIERRRKIHEPAAVDAVTVTAEHEPEREGGNRAGRQPEPFAAVGGSVAHSRFLSGSSSCRAKAAVRLTGRGFAGPFMERYYISG